MYKTILLTIGSICTIPFMAYGALQLAFPSDPDIVYVKSPSLFAAKWEKVASADDFSEYIDKSKVIRNGDMTITTVSMRNYSRPQSNKNDESIVEYKSEVLTETIDCFNQTIETTKVYLIGENFARGAIVEDPIEITSLPRVVRPASVGHSKVRIACEVADYHDKTKQTKLDFMRNI